MIASSSWTRTAALLLAVLTTVVLRSTSTIASAEIVEELSLDERGVVADVVVHHNRRRRRRRRLRRQHFRGHSESAFVFLTSNLDADVEELCVALRSLELAPSSSSSSSSSSYYVADPALVFHEGDLFPEQLDRLASCADGRPVGFPTVTLHHDVDYPPGFGDPRTEWNAFMNRASATASSVQSRTGASVFGYAQIVRFWTTRVWEHPAVQQFETLTRLDTDSCLVESVADNPRLRSLPGLPSSSSSSSTSPVVYQTLVDWHGVQRHYLDDELSLRVEHHAAPLPPPRTAEDCYDRFARGERDHDGALPSHGLWRFANEYLEKTAAAAADPALGLPRAPALWDAATSAWTRYCRLPNASTHAEVLRRDFFQRPEVVAWHRAVTEGPPFGVFRERWDDARIRFLTLALFATEDEVSFAPRRGVEHGPGVCAALDVDGMVARRKETKRREEEEEKKEKPSATTTTTTTPTTRQKLDDPVREQRSRADLDGQTKKQGQTNLEDEVELEAEQSAQEQPSQQQQQQQQQSQQQSQQQQQAPLSPRTTQVQTIPQQQQQQALANPSTLAKGGEKMSTSLETEYPPQEEEEENEESELMDWVLNGGSG